MGVNWAAWLILLSVLALSSWWLFRISARSRKTDFRVIAASAVLVLMSGGFVFWQSGFISREPTFNGGEIDREELDLTAIFFKTKMGVDVDENEVCLPNTSDDESVQTTVVNDEGRGDEGRFPCPHGVEVECADVSSPQYVLGRCKIQLPLVYCNFIEPPMPDTPVQYDFLKEAYCGTDKPGSILEGIAECDLCHEICHYEDWHNGWSRRCESEQRCYGVTIACLERLTRHFCPEEAEDQLCPQLRNLISRNMRTVEFNKCVCEIENNETLNPNHSGCFECAQSCQDAGATPQFCDQLRKMYCKDLRKCDRSTKP